mgnify:FL=1
MTVSISTVGFNTGNAGTWTPNDIITCIGEALSLQELHGSTTDSGLICGIATYSGDNTIPSEVNIRYLDVRGTSSGLGTDASFDVMRNASGQTYGVYVNRPGVGYTGGEVVTISAEDIGGASNGASDMTFQVIVDANISNGVSYAVTVTGTYLNYTAEGWDRNGYQGPGTDRTFTFMEGDSIKFHNTIVDEASTYDAYTLTHRQNKMWAEIDKVVSFYTAVGSGTSITWTPNWGERGTYYWNKFQYVNQEHVHTIVIQPADSANVTSVSYGSTTAFYDVADEGNAAVWKQELDSSKTYGTNYWYIYADTSGNVHCAGGNGYHPTDHQTRFPAWFQPGASNPAPEAGSSVYTVWGHAFGPRSSRGSKELDLWNGWATVDQNIHNNINNPASVLQNNAWTTFTEVPIGRSSYEVNLRMWKSGLDPSFVVFSWYYPTLSSSTIQDNGGRTWWWHNYTTTLFDLDYVQNASVTHISRDAANGNTAAKIRFETPTNTTNYNYRNALRGYCNIGAGIQILKDYYAPMTVDDAPVDYDSRLLYRPATSDYYYTARSTNVGNALFKGPTISNNAATNNIIKNIPTCSKMVPCPYYLPDDFALFTFDYNAISANINQGDTITVSGSEVWQVIDGSYCTNEGSSRTSGIIFCARIV